MTQTPGVEMHTDEALDVMYDISLQRQEKAGQLGAQAEPLEEEAKQRRADALALKQKADLILRQAREDADDCLHKASAQEAAAEEASGSAAALRQQQTHHRNVATDLARTVQANAEASGRQHPAERRDRYVSNVAGVLDPNQTLTDNQVPVA